MTNQASELFELCKEVYKRTDWVATRDWIREDGLLVDYNVWATSTPLYTSDYLLEKLQPLSERDFSLDERTVSVMHKKWGNWQAYFKKKYDSHNDTWIEGSADTPLKALLKLTIALSEAGELK